MTIDQTRHVLTVSGALPFLLAVILYDHTFVFDVPIDKVISAYAVIIISFICGVQWQYGAMLEQKTALAVTVLSNAIALVAWAVFLLASPAIAYFLYALCFVILLLVDIWWIKVQAISRPFFRSRCIASALVISSLVALGLHAAF